MSTLSSFHFRQKQQQTKDEPLNSVKSTVDDPSRLVQPGQEEQGPDDGDGAIGPAVVAADSVQSPVCGNGGEGDWLGDVSVIISLALKIQP